MDIEVNVQNATPRIGVESFKSMREVMDHSMSYSTLFSCIYIHCV